MAYRARRLLSSSVQVKGDDNDEYQGWSKARQSRHSSHTDTSASRRGLATSVSAFFSKLRPRKHPERGFPTHGHHGVQNVLAEAQGETTSKYTLETGEVYESDIIPAECWNTPIPIPPRTHSLSNNSRVLRKPSPISATRRLQQNDTGTTANPRQPSVTNGLILDGAANPVSRKPPLSTAIQRASSAPPRRSNNRISDQLHQQFLAKQEARRRRQSLKESGDFLGVTGFNPHTGEWDVLTQTTSSGEGSPDENQHVAGLAEKAQEAQAAYEQAKNEAQAQRDKRKKEAKGKQAALLEQHQIRWRREERQWSSAAEPRLSPIPQSRRTSGATQTNDSTNDSTTVNAEHVSFLEPGAAPQTAEIARCRHTSREATESQTPLGIKSTNSKPIPQADAQVPLKSCMRQTRTVRLAIPPTIPHRSGPSQQDTSPPPLKRRASRETHIEPGPENQNLAENWARSLFQDLDGLEKSIAANTREMKEWAGSIAQDIGGLGTVVRSVCTPTTTITGSALSPRPSNDCGETDVTLQDTLPEAVSTLAPTESPPSETSENKNGCSSPLAFQPPKQLSAWSSLPDLSLQTAPEPRSDEAAAKQGQTEEPKQEAPTRLPSPPPPGPDADTTLSRPRTATNASERPFHVALMMNHHRKKDIRKTMRANEDHQSVLGNKISPPTSTSTETPSHPSNSPSKSTTKSKLRQGVHSGEDSVRHLNQSIAQGAARLAFAHHVPQPATGTSPVSGPMDDEINHGVEEDTGEADQAGTGSGDGGDRGTVKTVMGAEAGHDDGHADLAGTAASCGPLLTALFGVTSADNDHIRNGDWLMVIGVQPQQREEDTDNRHPLALPIHGDMLLLPAEAAQQPPDSALVDWMPVPLRKVVLMVRQLVCAYWDLVRPAFDADSPLRQRLEQREQVTVQDYGICILALLFLILAGSAGAWTIRITMEVVCLIGVLARAILRVMLALAGFV